MRHGHLAALLLVAAVLGSPAARATEVIAHGGHPSDAIERSLLRGVFGMRVRAWPDGRAVRVYVLEDPHPLHQDFCKSVLRMYPYQLRQNWDRLLYSGTGQPPVVVSSEDELMRRVAETPGAIGYLAYRPSTPKARKSTGAPLSVKVLDVR